MQMNCARKIGQKSVSMRIWPIFAFDGVGGSFILWVAPELPSQAKL